MALGYLPTTWENSHPHAPPPPQPAHAGFFNMMATGMAPSTIAFPELTLPFPPGGLFSLYRVLPLVNKSARIIARSIS